MKKLVLTGVLLLAVTACSTPSTVLEQPGTGSPSALRTTMEEFISLSQPNRSVGRLGHIMAMNWIKSRFEKLAASSHGKFYDHEFLPDVDFAIKNYQNDFDTLVKPKFRPKTSEYKKWKGFTDGAISFVKKYRGIKGHNLILEIPGQKNPAHVLTVGAHYDSITHDHATLTFTPDTKTAGADDNASGIVALLSIAESLAAHPHDKTIRIVAFDYEEIFFLGSYAMAKDISQNHLPGQIAGEREDGLINLEMIGWSKTPLASHPVFKIYTRSSDKPGADDDMQLAQIILQYSSALKSPLQPAVLPNNFDRSDNWSYWRWSYPAVCVSQDWEKDFNESHYHTSGDVPATLNFDYLAEITKVVAGTLQFLLHSPL